MSEDLWLPGNATPPDAEAVARETMFRTFAEVTLDAYDYPGERSAENARRIDAAVDAYREAVERRVRAEYEEDAKRYRALRPALYLDGTRDLSTGRIAEQWITASILAYPLSYEGDSVDEAIDTLRATQDHLKGA